MSAKGSPRRQLPVGSVLMWVGVLAVLIVTLRGVLNERAPAPAAGTSSSVAVPSLPASSPEQSTAGPPPRSGGPPSVDATALLTSRCGSKTDCACVRDLVDELLIKSSIALAIDALKARGDACGGTPGLSDLRAEALAREGDWSTAQPLAQRIALEQSGNPWAAYALARCALLRDDLEGAKAAADRAIALGRKTAHGIVGQIFLKQQKYPEALQALQSAIDANAQDVEALYFVGVVERQQQHYRPAREAFLSALSANKSFADARFQLGDLTHSIGAFDEARHHLQKLSALVAEDDPRFIELAAKMKKGSKQPSPVYTAPTGK